MFQSLRFALRALRRSPVFSLTSLASIGLGIGACTSVFAVVNAVLFEPPPFEKPDRLVQLMATEDPASTQPADYIAPLRMLDWLDRDFRTLESVGAYAESGFRIEVEEGFDRVGGEVDLACGIRPISR